ncbi:unnamed protein product, partial [Vitis vinifera]
MKPSRLKIMEKVFIFFVVRLVVILFGCQESMGKLKKINFHFFCGLASCDSVWLPRKCGKVENFVFIFLLVSSDTIFVTNYVSNFIYLFFKHKTQFVNLIMICRERLCFSAWLKNYGFRVREI